MQRYVVAKLFKFSCSLTNCHKKKHL